MSQVVVVAGMHRSGTSMITRLLNLCGMYLGPESDLIPAEPANLEGYWENSRFLLLNDELLARLGGGWDHPPKLDAGWEKSQRLSDIRSKAAELIDLFSSHRYWGWKDPRNSLTLPFWNEIIPSMKVVICVRNPIEVTNSLLKRNYLSPALAFHLWLEYNHRILKYTKPKNRIITDYDSFFHDPRLELKRILKFLEIDCQEDTIRHSISTVDAHLRHNQATLSDLENNVPIRVLVLYQKMYEQTQSDFLPDILPKAEKVIRESRGHDDLADETVKILLERLQSAKQVISKEEEHIQDLSTQLASRDYELSEIYRSKAWRFVQFVRRTRKRILG